MDFMKQSILSVYCVLNIFFSFNITIKIFISFENYIFLRNVNWIASIGLHYI